MQSRSATRDDLAREIEARLEIRRRFYIVAFLAVTTLVLFSLVIAWGSAGPSLLPYAVLAAVAPILGTGTVLWWLYVLRRAALYEEVGRRFLSGR